MANLFVPKQHPTNQHYDGKRSALELDFDDSSSEIIADYGREPLYRPVLQAGHCKNCGNYKQDLRVDGYCQYCRDKYKPLREHTMADTIAEVRAAERKQANHGDCDNCGESYPQSELKQTVEGNNWFCYDCRFPGRS